VRGDPGCPEEQRLISAVALVLPEALDGSTGNPGVLAVSFGYTTGLGLVVKQIAQALRIAGPNALPLEVHQVVVIDPARAALFHTFVDFKAVVTSVEVHLADPVRVVALLMQQCHDGRQFGPWTGQGVVGDPAMVPSSTPGHEAVPTRDAHGRRTACL